MFSQHGCDEVEPVPVDPCWEPHGCAFLALQTPAANTSEPKKARQDRTRKEKSMPFGVMTGASVPRSSQVKSAYHQLFQSIQFLISVRGQPDQIGKSSHSMS